MTRLAARAGLDRAIAEGLLELHQSRAYVLFTVRVSIVLRRSRSNSLAFLEPAHVDAVVDGLWVSTFHATLRRLPPRLPQRGADRRIDGVRAAT